MHIQFISYKKTFCLLYHEHYIKVIVNDDYDYVHFNIKIVYVITIFNYAMIIKSHILITNVTIGSHDLHSFRWPFLHKKSV